MNKNTYQYELFKQIIHDAKKNQLAFSEDTDYIGKIFNILNIGMDIQLPLYM